MTNRLFCTYNNYDNLQEYLKVHGIRNEDEGISYGIPTIELVKNSEDFINDKTKMWMGWVNVMYNVITKPIVHTVFSIYYNRRHNAYMVRLGIGSPYYCAELFSVPGTTKEALEALRNFK